MIKDINDSHFLEMLAHWFEMQHKLKYHPESASTEIQVHLHLIAAKLKHIENNFTDSDLDWPPKCSK